MTNTRFSHMLADLKPGNHLCCLYETKEEHRAVLTFFVRQGLERGEKALCIVDSVAEGKVDVHNVETVLSYLRDDGLDVDDYLARRQLVFCTHDATYMQKGVFDPESMIALLRAETEQALGEGYAALRVSDEMTWVLQGLPGSERLIEYEARLEDFLRGSQCLLLYQYDRRRWKARVLLDVLHTHPVAVVGTEVYDNPYYIPPAELLGPDPPAAELRHWIQNLAEHQQVDDALRKRTRDLEKRAKELHCLFSISRLVEEPGISLEEILQGIVDLIPPAWQYPQVAAARVLVGDQSFETNNLKQTVWKQSSDIVVQGERIGALEVCYLAERPEGDEGPFLKEEKSLLNAIAERLGRIIERIRAETERVLAKQMLEQRVQERTREIERRRQVAEGLRDILAVLNSNRSLNEILDYILGQACRLLGAEAVAVYRLESEGELLNIQAARGLDPGYVADANIPVGQSVTGQAVLKRQPVTLSDVAAVSPDDDLSLDRQRRALLERLGSHYRALLAVPLKNGKVYGAITLYYHKPRAFADEEIRLAVAFSDQVALAIQNAQLRAQVEQTAVAAERSRLARELHDSVTQILFSASLMAEVLPVVWERDQVEGQQALDEIRELTRGALAEMRTLLMELRPAALTKAKLDDLLRQLAEGVIGRARVPVTLKVEGQGALPPDVHVALYRIAQETLNNVAKHAEASQATVGLYYAPPPAGETEGGRVELRISDDGRGFDVDQVSSDHLGLGIMRERAEGIGATLTIKSQPGHGAQVVVTWTDTQGTKDDDRTETDSSDSR